MYLLVYWICTLTPLIDISHSIIPIVFTFFHPFLFIKIAHPFHSSLFCVVFKRKLHNKTIFSCSFHYFCHFFCLFCIKHKSFEWVELRLQNAKEQKVFFFKKKERRSIQTSSRLHIWKVFVSFKCLTSCPCTEYNTNGSFLCNLVSITKRNCKKRRKIADVCDKE